MTEKSTLEYLPIMMDIDSSKIKDAMRCMRYYLYRHIFGWQGGESNHDLVFGSAWHEAKAYMLINGMQPGWIDHAMEAFNKVYRESFDPITDLDMYPKSPAGAYEALQLYETSNMGEPLTAVTIQGKPAVEIFGTVVIGPSRKLLFKMDGIVNTAQDLPAFIDHKSSKSDNPLYQSIYSISTQMMTYYHALACLMGHIDHVYGGLVDVTIFRRKGHAHHRIPIRKTLPMMEEWLANVNWWYDLIEKNTNDLFNNIDRLTNNNVINLFPRCDPGCTAYYRECPYYNMCIAWPNPLQHLDSIPTHMERKFWSPKDEEKKARMVVEA